MRSSVGARVTAQNASPDGFPIPSLLAHVTALLALHCHRPFHRDSVFLLLSALGPTVWIFFIGLFGFMPMSLDAIWSAAFLSVALWQPLLEELLFRGVVQVHLQESMARRKTRIGLSLPNIMTSILFSMAHLGSHSTSWSLIVFVPSLCFGFVRDRFDSVYPAIALHVFYNTGYFLLIGWVTLPPSH